MIKNHVCYIYVTGSYFLNFIIKFHLVLQYNKISFVLNITFYGEIKFSLPKKLWFNSNENRSFISTICRLRFNYNLSLYNWFKMSPVSDTNHLIISFPFLIKLKFYFQIASNSLIVLEVLYNFIRSVTIKLQLTLIIFAYNLLSVTIKSQQLRPIKGWKRKLYFGTLV